MKTRNILLLILNSLLVVCVLGVAVTDLCGGTASAPLPGTSVHAGYFTAFTVDSNVLMGLIALLTAVFAARALRTGAPLPMWLRTVYLTGTTGLALTFVTVALLLAPQIARAGNSYFLLFSNSNFFNHFLDPVLAVVSLTAVEKGQRLPPRRAWLGMITMMLYAVIYFLCVAVFRVWPDIYNFTFGGHLAVIPVVVAVIAAVTCGLARALTALHNLGIPKQEQ